jgi:hypothetical protein
MLFISVACAQPTPTHICSTRSSDRLSHLAQLSSSYHFLLRGGSFIVEIGTGEVWNRC